MQRSTFYRADQITEPHEVGVVCVRKRNGKFNLTPVTSWNTFGDDKFAFITFVLKNTSHSAYCIVDKGMFTFSVPDVKVAEEVHLLGQHKGVYTNKLEVISLEMENLGGRYYGAPKESCVVYCCKLRQYVAHGDYFVFICEVVEVYANEKLKPLFSYDSRTALGGANRPRSVINDIKEETKLQKKMAKNQHKG